MTVALLVVCEARADFEIASDLADRVLCEQVEWIDASLLPALRQWWAAEPQSTFVRWTELDRLAATHGLRLRPRSRFSGEPGAADAAAADKALQLASFLGREQPLSAVLLIRDSDNQQERRRGFAQARVPATGAAWPFAVVIGLAHPKREAWVLAGFEPQDDAEEARLAELRQDLGHDPCAASERISARSKGAKRDIKRVLDHLTGDDVTREPACWQTTSLARLKQRGDANGLADYLAEIEAHVLPILTQPQARP